MIGVVDTTDDLEDAEILRGDWEWEIVEMTVVEKGKTVE